MPIQYLCLTHEYNCESQQTVCVGKPDNILGGILQIINIPCKSRLLLTYKFWYHWKKKHKSAFIIFPIPSQLYVYITIHIYLNMFVTSKPYQNSVF